jgi:hypothetical protein
MQISKAQTAKLENNSSKDTRANRRTPTAMVKLFLERIKYRRQAYL